MKKKCNKHYKSHDFHLNNYYAYQEGRLLVLIGKKSQKANIGKKQQKDIVQCLVSIALRSILTQLTDRFQHYWQKYARILRCA